MRQVVSTVYECDPYHVYAELRSLLQTYGLVSGCETIDHLRDSERRLHLLRALETAIRSELPVGIASVGEVEGSSAPQLRLRRDGQENLLPRDSLRTAQDFFESAGRHTPRGASDRKSVV